VKTQQQQQQQQQPPPTASGSPLTASALAYHPPTQHSVAIPSCYLCGTSPPLDHLIFPCQHNFCHGCIVGYRNERSGPLHCPECGTYVPLGEDGEGSGSGSGGGGSNGVQGSPLQQQQQQQQQPLASVPPPTPQQLQLRNFLVSKWLEHNLSQSVYVQITEDLAKMAQGGDGAALQALQRMAEGDGASGDETPNVIGILRDLGFITESMIQQCFVGQQQLPQNLSQLQPTEEEATYVGSLLYDEN
jgi:hypothetical protein